MRVADLQHPHVVRSVRRVADVQSILPSRTRHVPRLLDLHRFLLVAGLAGLDRRRRLQLRTSRTSALWTLWQLTHDTLRASCMLPCQSACAPLLWHVRQVALTSRAHMR